jgi:hypothetical protein
MNRERGWPDGSACGHESHRGLRSRWPLPLRITTETALANVAEARAATEVESVCFRFVTTGSVDSTPLRHDRSLTARNQRNSLWFCVERKCCGGRGESVCLSQAQQVADGDHRAESLLVTRRLLRYVCVGCGHRLDHRPTMKPANENRRPYLIGRRGP